MNAPTIPVTMANMKDFLNFIYTNEPLLKQYGAIKIIPPTEFKDLLKRKQIKTVPPSTAQQVTRLDQSDFIYSVNTKPCSSRKKSILSLPIDEAAFWQLLSHNGNQQQISSVSSVPRKSFFLKRVQRTCFDIHLLPQRSLLKLCSSRLSSQFVPSLIRAHGPGAMFPLASARQRLFSFNYHHAGGVRYWYIVPASERAALERALQQQKTSICLDHGCVLIDPLMFNKYKIRYHRLIQKPNEIVVLAAGALSQSFTENAIWSESVDFALPSWLEDEHANAKISCACRWNIDSLPETIDVKLFNRTVIEQYIRTNLNTAINDKSLSNTG